MKMRKNIMRIDVKWVKMGELRNINRLRLVWIIVDKKNKKKKKE